MTPIRLIQMLLVRRGRRLFRGSVRQSVQWAENTVPSTADDMGVNLSGADILVPENVLHGSDIRTRFQQMRGEGVAKSVAACRFPNASSRHRNPHRAT